MRDCNRISQGVFWCPTQRYAYFCAHGGHTAVVAWEVLRDLSSQLLALCWPKIEVLCQLLVVQCIHLVVQDCARLV